MALDKIVRNNLLSLVYIQKQISRRWISQWKKFPLLHNTDSIMFAFFKLNKVNLISLDVSSRVLSKFFKKKNKKNQKVNWNPKSTSYEKL